MRSKRALLYLGAGVLCAFVAAFAAYKHLSKEGAAEKTVPRTQVLIATQDIGFGEFVVLPGGQEEPNAKFVPWPKDVLPEGAVHEEEQLGEQNWRASTDILKNEVLLKPRLVKDEHFVPEDMYLERVHVDPADVASGLLRPGMKVDVLKIVNRQPVDFMRCVKLYVIGSLDRLGKPKQDGGDSNSNVLLLIKMSQRQAFLAAKQAHDLLLREAAGPCGEGPQLVEDAFGEKAREREAKQTLMRAQAAMEAGRYEEAIEDFEQVLSEYGDVSGPAEEARRDTRRCRDRLARQLYERAQQALEEDQDFATALSLLDRIRQECPEANVSAEAERLRQQAKADLELSRRRAQYEALVQEIEQALNSGNLSAAQTKLEGLSEFGAEDLELPEGATAPEEAHAEYSRRLKNRQDEYRVNRQVLEQFLRQGEIERASEKLKQIQEQFPEHPENDELIGQVEDAQSGGSEE